QADRVYVAQNVGVEEARTFVHIDPTALPDDVAAASKLTLAEAADTTVVSAGSLLACSLTTPLGASGQLSAEAAPNVDSADAAFGALSGPLPPGTDASADSAYLRPASSLPLTTVQRAAATPAGHPRRASSPPSAVVLGLVGLLALGGGLLARRRHTPPPPN